VREHVRLEPLIHGASHELGRRAGTESVLLDVGLGAACATAQSWLGMKSAGNCAISSGTCCKTPSATRSLSMDTPLSDCQIR